MIRRLYRRARWVFLGEVAEFACEYDEYDDPGLMAVTMPFVTAATATAFLLAALQTGTLGTPSGYLTAAVTALCGLTMVLMTVLSTGAAVVYATQTTELPAGEEVVTRE